MQTSDVAVGDTSSETSEFSFCCSQNASIEIMCDGQTAVDQRISARHAPATGASPTAPSRTSLQQAPSHFCLAARCQAPVRSKESPKWGSVQDDAVIPSSGLHRGAIRSMIGAERPELVHKILLTRQLPPLRSELEWSQRLASNSLNLCSSWRSFGPT